MARHSGEAPGKAGVSKIYRLESWDKVNPKDPSKNTYHDHQGAFKNDQARLVTLYSIAKILQELP